MKPSRVAKAAALKIESIFAPGRRFRPAQGRSTFTLPLPRITAKFAAKILRGRGFGAQVYPSPFPGNVAMHVIDRRRH